MVTGRKKGLSSGSSAPASIVMNYNGQSKKRTLFVMSGAVASGAHIFANRLESTGKSGAGGVPI